MHLKRTVLTLVSAGAVCAGIAAGAPVAVVAAGAVAIGTLAGFSVTSAREGRRKRFDQETLQEEDKTTEAYREQKRQAFVKPTVGVITRRPFWEADNSIGPDGLNMVDATEFCKIYRKIPKDWAAGTTIDARYHSGTKCYGTGYYCLADGAKELTDVIGSAQIPTTARIPIAYSQGQYPHGQTLEEFTNECQAVIDYCGRR